jgi:hypothetical protein
MSIEEIRTKLEETMHQIRAAPNLATAASLVRRATEYENAIKTLVSVEQRLRDLEPLRQIATAPSNGEGKLRELPVEITGGARREHYLALTKHIKSGRVQIGEDFIIETEPSGERFRTELLAKGNKLRERGAIGRFFDDAGVHEGDFVVLVETAPKRWTLKKAPPGVYRGRRSILESL